MVIPYRASWTLLNFSFTYLVGVGFEHTDLTLFTIPVVTKRSFIIANLNTMRFHRFLTLICSSYSSSLISDCFRYLLLRSSYTSKYWSDSSLLNLLFTMLFLVQHIDLKGCFQTCCNEAVTKELIRNIAAQLII